MTKGTSITTAEKRQISNIRYRDWTYFDYVLDKSVFSVKQVLEGLFEVLNYDDTIKR